MPARVVYLIAAGSRTGFRRAVQEASSRWAGMTEMIVPVTSRGRIAPSWAQMIEHGAYDCLVNVDVEEDAAARAQRAIGLPVVRIASIDRIGQAKWTTHPANVSEIRPRDNASVMATSSDAPLWEIAAAGDLSADHMDELDGTAFVRRPRTADELGRAQIHGITLLQRGLEQFEEHRTVNAPGPPPVICWVTTPNNLHDCLWFWNCRALRPLRFDEIPMYLWPHRGLENWVDFDSQFRSQLARAVDVHPDVILGSFGVSEERLREIAKLLGLRRSTKKFKATRRFPEAPIRTPPFTYGLNFDPRAWVLFERFLGRTTDAVIHTGTETTLLRTESPVRFQGSGYTTLTIASAAFDHLPRLPVTANMVLRDADWAGDRLRIRTNAQNSYQFTLSIPDIREATWAALRSAAPRAQLSDKGRLAHSLDDRNPSVLLEPGALALIAALTTPRSSRLLNELRRLEADGRIDTELRALAATWGGRTERRDRAIDDLRAELGQDVYSVAERLTSNRWAERGLVIRCGECSIRSFVPLRSAADHPACPACGAAQQYAGPKGPSIHYRLNGLVDRASDQGALPHLLVQSALSARNPNTHLLLGVDLRPGEKPEVDIFGLHGGQIVAGEAKTSPADFTLEQLERDVAISRSLGAHLHVLASLTPVNPEAVRRAWSLLEPSGTGLLLVEGRDVRLVDGDLLDSLP